MSNINKAKNIKLDKIRSNICPNCGDILEKKIDLDGVIKKCKNVKLCNFEFKVENF